MRLKQSSNNAMKMVFFFEKIDNICHIIICLKQLLIHITPNLATTSEEIYDSNDMVQLPDELKETEGGLPTLPPTDESDFAGASEEYPDPADLDVQPAAPTLPIATGLPQGSPGHEPRPPAVQAAKTVQETSEKQIEA